MYVSTVRPQVVHFSNGEVGHLPGADGYEHSRLLFTAGTYIAHGDDHAEN